MNGIAPDQRRANVIGLGLIGGSIALALRKRGWTVHGSDAAPDHVTRAVELEVIDAGGIDVGATITFVATPVGALAAAVADALERTTGLVTDVGSVKSPVASAVRDPRFIAGHPMAGSPGPAVSSPCPRSSKCPRHCGQGTAFRSTERHW